MTQVPDSLKKMLAEKKSGIVSKWFHSLCQEYPDKTMEHLKNTKSQFANPVGHNLHQGLEGIFDQVLEDVDPEKLRLNLDKIVRIKAVQDFSPSQAVAFIFILKKLIKEEFRSKLGKEVKYADLDVIDQRIDGIALIAFDIYTQCREAIYQLRIDEVKKRCSILERVNLLNQGPVVKEHVERTQ